MNAVLLVRSGNYRYRTSVLQRIAHTLVERFQRARLDYNTMNSTDPYRKRPVKLHLTDQSSLRYCIWF